MLYCDIKKWGLVGILPVKKRYGSKKDIAIVTEAIKSNKTFIQYALQEEQADYLGEIMGSLVEWVIKCNEVYYNYELKCNL